MGYWGMLYAMGPNYNRRWEFFGPGEVEEVLRKGHELLDLVEPLMKKVSQALVWKG